MTAQFEAAINATPTLPEKPWTVSQVEAFEQCARRYAAQYEFKTIPFVETEAMKAGTRAHQQLYLRMASQERPIALPASLDKAEATCASLSRGGIVHAEKSYGLTKDFRIVDMFDKQAWHRGKIDVMVVNQQHGAAVVVDWKTGNPQYEKPFQLECYAVVVMRQFEFVQKVSTANYWLRDMKLGNIHTFTRKNDMQRVQAEMMSRAHNIVRAREAGSWPPMQNPFCAGCEVLTCEFRREKRK